MADRGHVHADLVRPARLEPAFDQRCVAQDFETRANGLRRVFRARLRRSKSSCGSSKSGRAERRPCPSVAFGTPVDDREIAPLDAVRGELPGEPLMSDVGLGDDQQPRRVLVDPVDDARPGNAADPRKAAAAMMQQRVDQSAVRIARRRMDDQPGGLVDDQQMLILEDNPQRDVLRFVVRGRGLRNGEQERLAAADLEGRVADRRRFWDSSAPLRISAFSRSRDRVGTASARARSSRQPAWPGASSTLMTWWPPT